MSTMMNVPQLRFSEFSGEWEEKKYGDIYSFYTTNSFSRDNLNYESGEVKNIHYGDIHTKFSTMFRLEDEYVPFANSELNLSKIKEDSYCQDGDLVIADASEDYADIGKTIELIDLNNEKVLAGLHTFLARPNKYDMALGYTGYLLQSWKVRWQVMRESQGTKVLSLSTKRLSNVILTIPQKQEQEKIASFLSSVDTKIEQLTSKAKLLQEYKKGVMQKIFSQEIRFRDDDGSEYPGWVEKKLGDLCKITTGKLDANAMVENGQYRFYTCAKDFFQIDN
ncbi:MAG: restriction endonuclease subunit S, partial [Campylobacterota bacterium]|nr:restriction endonuclease subunit S [Campylobacterota bacterium]